jgi:hypothetical protein
MLSRWLRWLVVAPVVLFVFGAIMLSCGGGGSGGTSGPAGPGFSLDSITIANGAPPTPTFTPTPAPSTTKTPRMPTLTPTLTPRPAATSSTVMSTGPDGVPTGGTVAFNAIGTLKKNKVIKLLDITTGTSTLWTSTDNTVLLPPAPGPMGGMYTTGFAGCVCIFASSSGVSSQQVGIGVYTDVGGCPICPTALPTPTPTPKPAVMPGASSTPAASGRNAGVLMWTFDAGSEVRGRIAAGADGSIFFLTRDGVLHGLSSSGKEVMQQQAAGSSPAVLPNGTVVAMSSASQLALFAPDGAILWQLEIGDSAGPLAATDHAIYAAAGGDLVSVSPAGTLAWRVSVGPVTTAAATPDGVVVSTPGGAVTAIAADGAVTWTFQPDGGFSGSLAYANDVVYAGSAAGGVYAIDFRTGNPIWHISPPQAVTTGPAIAPSGAIFAGGDAIYGISADGQLRWKDSTLKPAEAGLSALGYDGAFEATAGDVGAVIAGDGTYVWMSRSFGKITTAATSASGTLYVGTSTGRIFAVR